MSPSQGGRVPSLPNFGGLCLCRRTIKFDVVKRGGRMYLRVSHASYLKRAKFHCSPILGVLLHLCIHPLTQNGQIRHDDTYGVGHVFRSVTPLYLYKCVVPFVSTCLLGFFQYFCVSFFLLVIAINIYVLTMGGQL